MLLRLCFLLIKNNTSLVKLCGTKQSSTSTMKSVMGDGKSCMRLTGVTLHLTRRWADPRNSSKVIRVVAL
jgi:hypothetical protein